MSILRFSEGFSLALHSLLIIRASKENVSVVTLSDKLDASVAHLAKIMQRLVKADLVKSKRGPSGGFSISKEDKIPYMTVYKIIDGEYPTSICMFKDEKCTKDSCILGDLICNINNEVYTYLNTKFI